MTKLSFNFCSYLSRKKAVALYVLFLTVLTLYIYYPALNCPFMGDDYEYILKVRGSIDYQNYSKVKGVPNLWQFMITPINPVHWSPLCNFLFWTGNYFFVSYYEGYHIYSLFLHLITAFLLFKLVQKLFSNQAIALLTGLMFAVAPTSLPAVFWWGTVGWVLSGLLILLTLNFFVRYLETKKSTYYIFTICSAFLTPWAFSTAIITPLILLFFYWLSGKQKRGCWLGVLGVTAASLIYSIALVIMKEHLQFIRPDNIPTNNYLTLLTYVRIGELLKAIWFGCKTAFATFMGVCPGIEIFDQIKFIGELKWSLIGIATMCFLTLKIILDFRQIQNKWRKICFALSLIILPLLFTAVLRSSTHGANIFKSHGRYFYISSAGIALLIGLIMNGLSSDKTWLRKYNLLLICCVAVMIMNNAILVHNFNRKAKNATQPVVNYINQTRHILSESQFQDENIICVVNKPFPPVISAGFGVNGPHIFLKVYFGNKVIYRPDYPLPSRTIDPI